MADADGEQLELDINEVVAELSERGQLEFELAQLRVANRKMREMLRQARAGASDA